jgi:hypothetical protein
VKNINILRLVVDGEHCVAILDIDTVFGPIPFAETSSRRRLDHIGSRLHRSTTHAGRGKCEVVQAWAWGQE